MFGGGASKSVLMALSLCIGGLIGIKLCENMQYPLQCLDIPQRRCTQWLSWCQLQCCKDKREVAKYLMRHVLNRGKLHPNQAVSHFMNSQQVLQMISFRPKPSYPMHLREPIRTVLCITTKWLFLTHLYWRHPNLLQSWKTQNNWKQVFTRQQCLEVVPVKVY